MGTRGLLVRKLSRGGTPRWVIDFRYRDKDGREQRFRRDASIQAAAPARAEAHRLYGAAIATGSLETRAAAPTLHSFLEGTFDPLYMPRYRRATQVRYRALLRQGVLAEFGAKRVDAITPQAVRAYGATLLKRGVNPRAHVNLLRTLLRAAFECGVLEDLPVLPKLGKTGKKLPDAPSDEEVEAMLQHASGWLHLAIALAAYAGLRMGEVRALEAGSVDLKGQRIVVRHALSEDELSTPKSGHERIVPLTPRLAELLTEAIAGKPPSARLVVNARGGTPTRQEVLAAAKGVQRRHGLRERSFHSLRHFFCSKLVRVGASVEAVRLLAGHSNLAVTQRYVHAAAGELREAMSRFGQ